MWPSCASCWRSWTMNSTDLLRLLLETTLAGSTAVLLVLALRVPVRRWLGASAACVSVARVGRLRHAAGRHRKRCGQLRHRPAVAAACIQWRAGRADTALHIVGQRSFPHARAAACALAGIADYRVNAITATGDAVFERRRRCARAGVAQPPACAARRVHCGQ